MIKYYILGLFLVVVNFLNAQNSLQFSEKAYLNADHQLYYLTNVAATGMGGLNQIWDFSHLEKLNEVKSFLHPLDQREWAQIFPKANMIIEENDLMVFIRADKNTLTEYGHIKGERLMVYNEPIVRFPFPFEYGSTAEGNYSGVRHYRQERKMSGKFRSEADGYGILILPDDRVYEDVIRVRFSKSMDNNLSEEIIYRWYLASNAPVSRSPLLTIFTREEAGEKEITGAAFISSEASWLASETDLKKESVDKNTNLQSGHYYQYKIHPNPFTDFAIIEYSIPVEGNVTIQSFDNNGRLIATILEAYKEAGKHSLKFEANDVFVQHLRIQVDNKFVASKKVFHLNSN